MHSTKVSFRHLRLHTQFKFIVKNEFVAIYGIVAAVAASGLSANTLNVAQHPSIFSILNTLEQTTSSSPHVTFSFVVGILHGVPLPQQVYNMIGRVLKVKLVAVFPKNPLSQVSRQPSSQTAFC